MRPVNRLAAEVTGKGVHYEPQKKIAQQHWEIQPPTIPTPRNIRDLSGIRFGRFTVLGLYSGGGGLWVVRCVCGDFETRRSRAINNPRNTRDRCDKCSHLRHLQRHDEFLRKGKNDEST